MLYTGEVSPPLSRFPQLNSRSSKLPAIALLKALVGSIVSVPLIETKAELDTGGRVNDPLPEFKPNSGRNPIKKEI